MSAAGVARVGFVFDDVGFLAGDADLLGVDDDDEIAGVDVRGVSRLVLAWRMVAMLDARRPRTSPAASMTCHWLETSDRFAK
jgi:hypothetical protein